MSVVVLLPGVVCGYAWQEAPWCKLTRCEPRSCARDTRVRLKKGKRQAQGRTRSSETEETTAVKQGTSHSGEVAEMRTGEARQEPLG
ncbi:hypothetical protein NDU88_004749 [Pleurodeles waltl]|uniref:Secreted protein n=1 Tax=Pleurodeles waltl TaxID=8319 RepID=A0AAV7SJT2_PLEWA|nr:hypothetical protein NDU88_004749 [Pleurodeles waltl]